MNKTETIIIKYLYKNIVYIFNNNIYAWILRLQSKIKRKTMISIKMYISTYKLAL